MLSDITCYSFDFSISNHSTRRFVALRANTVGGV